MSRGPLCLPRLSLLLAQGMVVSEWGWNKVRGGLLAQGLSELDGACPEFRMAGSQVEGLCPEHSEALGEVKSTSLTSQEPALGSSVTLPGGTLFRFSGRLAGT